MTKERQSDGEISEPEPALQEQGVEERLSLMGLHCYGGLLLGEERPYYSPFTGAFMGPPLTDKTALRLVELQELPHHALSATSTMSLMRKIAGNIHDYILLMGGLIADTPFPNALTDDLHLMDVPRFMNCGILRHLDVLLDRVHETTILTQEVFALASCVEEIALARDANEDWAADIDPDSFETYSIANTDIEGFGEIYRRFKEATEKSPDLMSLIPTYSLNGPPPTLLRQQELKAAREDPQAAPLALLLLKATLAAADETDPVFGEWDSPDVRFARALSVAEKMPAFGKETRRSETLGYLIKNLGDLTQSISRVILGPDELEIPAFASLLGGGKVLEDWSSRLWRSSRGYSSEQEIRPSTAAPNSGARRKESPEAPRRENQPTFYLEHHPDKKTDKYRVHILRQEDAPLLLSILQMEFLREQLFTGRGLVCLFDMLDGHQHPSPPEDPSNPEWRHWRMMGNIWDLTRLADDPKPEWYWDPPSCLSQIPLQRDRD